MAKKALKAEEKEYIQQNCFSKTDEEIATYLNRDIRTVRSYRKTLGIKKGASGRIEKAILKATATPDAPTVALVANSVLNEEQRKSFFKTQLLNSLYYNALKEQFTKEELDFYLEEWGALALQFEDIVSTEKRQIDELIKTGIIGNRILRNVKIAEEEIQKLQEEVQELRKNTKDIETNEEAQERDVQLINLIRTISAQTQAMSNDYQRNIDTKNKLLGELNGRRKDRIDQIKKGGTTFIGLVESFRERDRREREGRHMELVRIAREEKKNRWRQPTTYPDATKDCVLMDEKSILPEKEYSMMSDSIPRSIKNYSSETNKVILMIDNDPSKYDILSSILKENRIEFCTDAEKALDYLKENKVDLVCLNDSIEKGSSIDVANFVITNDICRNTDFLTHSKNENFISEVKRILEGKRNIESYDFEELKKYAGEKNA